MWRHGGQGTRALIASVVAALVVAVAVLVLASGTAGAACGNPLPVAANLETGPVFVGTVVSTRNEGTWATFAVEEVWAGEVADEVEVKGAPQHDLGGGKWQGISEMRSFLPGVRYLVAPSVATGDGSPFDFGAAGELIDISCSSTVTWNESLAVDRPADARIIARTEPIEIIGALSGPSVDDDDPPWPWMAAAAGLVLVVGIGAVVALRPGRRNDRPIA